MAYQKLYHDFVEPTFTVQDAVIEFIFRQFGDRVYDETPESAQTLNERIKWQKRDTEIPFAKAFTFEWKGEKFVAVRSQYKSYSTVGIYKKIEGEAE